MQIDRFVTLLLEIPGSAPDVLQLNSHHSSMSFITQAQQDMVLEEYDQFDDFLEMVVQFGVRILNTFKFFY
jgi:hypothetical protein